MTAPTLNLKKCVFFVAAVAVLVACLPFNALAADSSVFFQKVSATDSHTAVTIAGARGSVTGATIYNSGTNEVYVQPNGTATASTTEIPAGGTLTLSDFDVISLGVICATGETATVYVYATLR